MNCPLSEKSYSINRVYPRSLYSNKNEILRGVVEHHPLTKCSEATDLVRHIQQRKAPDGLISYRVHDKDTYYFNLPPNTNEVPDFIRNGQCSQLKSTNRLSLDEVDLIIRNELARKRHSIKRLFEDSSVADTTAVSKGPLLKIFATLCPNLTIDLFHRLLERYGLDKEYTVSFRQFEEAFTAEPLGKNAPPVIHKGLGSECYLSVARAFRMLQEIACDPSFDLKRLLPPSCFEPNGHVLCPQLRDALKLMRVNLTEENFRRLWTDKLDIEKVGSIRTSQLCRILGLKEDGTPIGLRAEVTPLAAADVKGTPKVNRDPKLLELSKRPPFKLLPPAAINGNSEKIVLKNELPTAGGPSFPFTPISDWRAQAPGGANSPLFGCGDRYQERLKRIDEHQPRFDDVMTCIKYKMEKPFQSMMVAFKRQDPKNLNRVHETDCLCVLREYGLPITSKDMSVFLRRVLSSSEATGWGIGSDRPPDTVGVGKDPVKIRPGLVPYKRLLAFYQNRAKGSRSRQIMKRLAAKPAGNSGETKDEYLTPDEIEEEFVKILHDNFIKFRRALREKSTMQKGIDEQNFRDILNQTIGFVMTQEQWENLQRHLEYIQPGIINWELFLNAFNFPSSVSEVATTNTFDATESHCPPNTEKYRGEMRDKTVLLKLVENTVRNRLRHIDKNYKHYDHQKLNMLCKEDFWELLAGQGLELIPSELNYLWGLLDEIEPGQELHNFRQVMNFFFNRTRPIVAEELRRRRYEKFSKIHDPNMESFVAWRTKCKELKQKENAELCKAAKIASTIRPRGSFLPKPTKDRLNELCTRIASLVQANWERLHRAFIQCDPSGSAKVLWDEFKKIARKFNFPLNDKELDELARAFDSPEGDYFSYLKFMQHFSKTLPSEKVQNTVFDERVHQFTNTKTGKAMTFVELLSEIRKACTSQWRTLQEAFRKLDKDRRGKISIDEIDHILRTKGIVLSQDDLYHLLSGYDRDMDGAIDYQEFLNLTLKSFKPITEV